jgi:sec-independent protein translocase protein TatB
MFGMSLTEIVVIAVVALVVLGPEKLPKVARTVGYLLGKARRQIDDIKNEIARETATVKEAVKLPHQSTGGPTSQ